MEAGHVRMSHDVIAHPEIARRLDLPEGPTRNLTASDVLTNGLRSSTSQACLANTSAGLSTPGCAVPRSGFGCCKDFIEEAAEGQTGSLPLPVPS